MTTRPARRSLSNAFTPSPGRASGLEGLLPARPSGSTADAPAALTAVPDETAVQPGQERKAAPASRNASRGPSPGAAASEGRTPQEPARVRNVAIYLPLELLERLKRTRRSRELTYADLLVEAAAAHFDSLESAFRVNSPPAASGGMPVRSRRRQPEPGVQVQIRLDGYQVAWLDDQVRRWAAPSRTALVVKLLEAHLT